MAMIDYQLLYDVRFPHFFNFQVDRLLILCLCDYLMPSDTHLANLVVLSARTGGLVIYCWEAQCLKARNSAANHPSNPSKGPKNLGRQ